MDRLTSMQIFVRVVEKGGFSAAAEEAGISPTMVGKHVRQLEEQLGVRLLNRTTRRQSLTEIGQLYFERCKQALLEIEAADASVKQMQLLPRGVLRVTAPATFGGLMLAAVIRDYLERYPDVELDLSLNDRVVDLVEEGFEVGLRIGALPDSSLVAWPLQPYRALVCASPDYLARHGVPQTPQQLPRHNCLSFVHGSRYNLWQFSSGGIKQEIEVHGNFRANNGLALRTAALQGIGIIMQPEALLRDEVAAGRLQRLLTDYELEHRPMHLVVASNRKMTPKLKSFIEFVLAHFGRDRMANDGPAVMARS
ncbi:LysR family transcriptional regulator [Collimonas sp.]|jgi:DNA-binding transcriptional LysR family regulator|uniref:LysR family transcriptional regulator n=1 Tax=Collimonas sp. TaxID=1963772 RepID=UPI002B84E384|nr:LysR family transcriptional regulator [Collimonas sp.]HWX00566.1 LysR family transcriptional regulator [Collimonas sp.]